MKIGKNLASIILAGTMTLVGAGCNSESDKEEVSIWAVRGDKNSPGFVRFHYRGTNYFDFGFDGTLDLATWYVNKEEKHMNKNMPGFERFVPAYEKARQMATKK